ncbi:hypothetical protein COX95_01005 [bacterium CG_4_10_14_0_2_um_filter_33_32]|nr:MAG: hypothetical protein AUJ93_01125 [bacterium CG2_30_33_46]PIU76870.1 MAG: hypothetical protein COS74_01635 [bacterium CG06_land_8_20_14_3_00_33_50]PIW81685.1 MAG: hypothetical protein COZ97_00620 [bacterium CG_4_8_14_3_um_filter_33_28]PIY84995.1 MAG: hypothetical protein COY76_04615 [bacterium CG_4_10_14_0_8_um_filter_33_57]PIZ86555.1 MAG: hypothetical protein COX95_01005 [bacterium CG_4_10_14_0_2_um_filter_33_32]PJA72202.1 MAG: hypothetical protein CO152_02515 [bacterium CG_4_9_14_3_um
MKATDLDKQLVAPCGINCAYCIGYLIKKTGKMIKGKYKGCIGCRSRNKQCAFLKGRCELLRENKIDFCYQCENFPCDNLKKLEARYKKKNWDTSFIENNERIKSIGLEKFILEQRKRFTCSKCKGAICIHTSSCFNCGHSFIENLK